MNFSENLRNARKAAGLTQQEVADLLPIHRTTYNKYERKGVEPPLSIVCRLAEVLNVSVNDLVK